RLLDLTRVLSAADEDHALREVDDDERVGARPIPLRVGVEVRHRDDGEVRLFEGRSVARTLDEEVADEEAVPGKLGDDPYPEAIRRVGADVAVLHEDFLAAQVLR